MPLAILLSSYVAGSRVGGMPQALALTQLGVDPCLIPTVTFGRRPGQGAPPGGAAVDPAVFRGMIDGVISRGLLGYADAVVTGYFAHPDQVEAAAELIEQARAASRGGGWGPAYGQRVSIVVDPVMGDHPDGLYVADAVAEAVRSRLVPLADHLTPNLWELEHLTGRALNSADEVVTAARTLERPVLTTSVPVDADRIGAVFADADEAWLFSHRRWEGAPHGTGDLVSAVYAAALIEGAPGREAAERAIRTVAEAVEAAEAWRAVELPIVALGGRLRRPTAELQAERLDLPGR
jgi:pyridoxine kinase